VLISCRLSVPWFCGSDNSPIRQPVQHRLAEPGVGDLAGPFGKGKVRGHDDRGLLSASGDYLEEQLRRCVRHDDIAEFVQHDQVVAHPATAQPRQLQLALCFDHLRYQFRRSGEAYALALPAGSDRQSNCQVTFPCACFTEQNDGFLALQILALAQPPHLRRGDVRRTLKVELLKRLDRREMRLLDAPDHGATFTFLDLCFEQSFQISQVRLLPADRLLGQTGELLSYGGQA
jgi:hypothetical protein